MAMFCGFKQRLLRSRRGGRWRWWHRVVAHPVSVQQGEHTERKGNKPVMKAGKRSRKKREVSIRQDLAPGTSKHQQRQSKQARQRSKRFLFFCCCSLDLSKQTRGRRRKSILPLVRSSGAKAKFPLFPKRKVCVPTRYFPLFFPPLPLLHSFSSLPVSCPSSICHNGSRSKCAGRGSQGVVHAIGCD